MKNKVLDLSVKMLVFLTLLVALVFGIMAARDNADDNHISWTIFVVVVLFALVVLTAKWIPLEFNSYENNIGRRVKEVFKDSKDFSDISEKMIIGVVEISCLPSPRRDKAKVLKVVPYIPYYAQPDHTVDTSGYIISSFFSRRQECTIVVQAAKEKTCFLTLGVDLKVGDELDLLLANRPNNVDESKNWPCYYIVAAAPY